MPKTWWALSLTTWCMFYVQRCSYGTPSHILCYHSTLGASLAIIILFVNFFKKIESKKKNKLWKKIENLFENFNFHINFSKLINELFNAHVLKLDPIYYGTSYVKFNMEIFQNFRTLLPIQCFEKLGVRLFRTNVFVFLLFFL